MLMKKHLPVILMNDVSRSCYIIIRPQVEKWEQMGLIIKVCLQKLLGGILSLLFSH